MIKKITGFVPNLITLLNLCAGTLAVIFAIDGELGWAGLFICVAALFDFFDGFAARLLKAYSSIGKELDSLADVISFGVAPGMILFTLLEYSLLGINQPIQQIELKWYLWFVLFSAFLIPAFSALRLAKFNIDTRQTRNFLGLPTPANALLWASFGLMLEFQQHTELMRLLFTTKNLLFIMLVTSFLLVSELPMFSLKFSGLSFSDNWHRYFFLAASLLLLLFLNVYGLPLVIFLYIAASVVFYLLKIPIDG